MMAFALACFPCCSSGWKLQFENKWLQGTGCAAAFNTALAHRQVRRLGCSVAAKSPAGSSAKLRGAAPLLRWARNGPRQADAATRRAMLSTLLVVASPALPALAGDVMVGGASFPAPGARKESRTGLKAKWLEKIRIFLQDEADAISYDGELAPGGPPPANPGLMLLPVVQMQATLKKLKPKLADQKLLSDSAGWDALLTVVSSGPFEPRESARLFNAYSDNIYYRSDSAEANIGLLGGTTPSTAQTKQYLWRNEALTQIEELCDEIKYQKGLAAEKRETIVAEKNLKDAIKAFDEYFKLAPEDDLKFAREGIYGPAGK